MSKKDFIALADAIRTHNERSPEPFTPAQIDALAKFCRGQNYNFKWDRWTEYIAGKCGPNGGAK